MSKESKETYKTVTCEGCGVLAGLGYTELVLMRYRDHDLCGYCVVAWKRLEKVLGREATFKEFREPKLSMFEGALWNGRKEVDNG